MLDKGGIMKAVVKENNSIRLIAETEEEYDILSEYWSGISARAISREGRYLEIESQLPPS